MPNITFPCLEAKLVPISKVVANDYNPNKVAEQEYELLIHSIEEDGLTQPIVTFYDKQHDLYIIVDGFHRYKALRDHFKCEQIPVVVIEKDIKQRMASTVRHNRARGKHQVDLVADLVKSLLAKGWDDKRIAVHLGMTEEEIVRLKQVVGIARMFAAPEYAKSWGDTND